MTRTSWSKGIAQRVRLGLLACLCCLAPAQASADYTWILSEVDNAADVGKYLSIAADGNKNLHLSYLEQTALTPATYTLRYATNKSGAWVAGPVQNPNLAAGAVVGAGTAVATDGTTKAPHIAYYYNGSTSNRGFRTIALSGSSWSDPTPINGSFGPNPDTAATIFNKAGFSHVAFVKNSGNGTNGTASLYYVKNSSEGNYRSWSTPVVVDSVNLSGTDNSIAVDSTGAVHIAGYNSSSTDLFYYTNASGAWVKTTVETSPAIVGKWCTLAVDASNTLHLAYLETTTSPATYTIKYRQKLAGQGWSAAVPAADAGQYGGFPSLRIDNSGIAHLSYYYATSSQSGSLRYATNLGGSWTSVEVDSTSADVGRYSNITLDSDQNVAIAYYDVTRSSVKVAYRKAALVASPSSLSFGSIDRSFESAALSVTVTNKLDVDEQLGALAKDGASAADYTVVTDTCSNARLAPGAACTITVRFAPPATAGHPEARSGRISLSASETVAASVSVQLSGATTENLLVTARGTNGGSISPAKVAVAPGGNQSFIVSAESGFWVDSVLAGGSTPLAAPSYVLSNVVADQEVVASFASPIRVSPSNIFFGSWQSAYLTLNDEWTIQTQDTAPAQDLLVDRNVSVNIVGGYDSSFTSKTGTSAATSLTVSNGTVNLEGIVFQ